MRYFFFASIYFFIFPRGMFTFNWIVKPRGVEQQLTTLLDATPDYNNISQRYSLRLKWKDVVACSDVARRQNETTGAMDDHVVKHSVTSRYFISRRYEWPPSTIYTGKGLGINRTLCLYSYVYLHTRQTENTRAHGLTKQASAG